jgi:hypothetical protein
MSLCAASSATHKEEAIRMATITQVDAQTIITLSPHGRDFAGDLTALKKVMVNVLVRGERCGAFSEKDLKLVTMICEGAVAK